MRQLRVFRFTFSSVAVAVAALVLVAATPSLVPGRLAAQPDCQTFPETGKSVCGRFLAYWREHGGLAQQGYPISEPLREKSDIDGKSYTVQYFERAVFEEHPENRPPNDVLLSLLGVLRYKEKYPNGAPDNREGVLPYRRYFPEAGKTIDDVFLSYWETHGGLAQQGYPISEPFQEQSDIDGKTYTVQYFERAVFELHPENQPPHHVLLSQLGMFQHKRKYAVATPTPTIRPDAWTELRQRPLNLPRVEAGATCPVTPRQLKPSTPPLGQDFYILGSGPVYLNAVAFDEDSTIRLKPSALQRNGWYIVKVPWMTDNTYAGAVLIRVRHLDGNSQVRMRVANEGPAPDIALNASEPDYFWPGETQFLGPGCYAYQVDGNGFSYAIVFRVVLDNSPPATPTP